MFLPQYLQVGYSSVQSVVFHRSSWGLPRLVKNLPANAGDMGSIWVRKLSWRRKWQSTPVFLPGKFHEQRTNGLQSMGSQRVQCDWAYMQHPGLHETGLFLKFSQGLLLRKVFPHHTNIALTTVCLLISCLPCERSLQPHTQCSENYLAYCKYSINIS